MSEAKMKHETHHARWLTADEATRYLGFPSRKALYQAVRRGQVPAHRLGRRLRFSAAEIDRLIYRTRTHLAA
jgi:excisionase family DNA binding protein